jgi:organic hydroperoxide reductase OsmC/OhrA
MPREHHYEITVRWTGNLGPGTSSYRSYSRNHEISGGSKDTVISGSSEPVFRGDASLYSPEELLVASLSACHMLWVLHLCADAGIVVTGYRDQATGTMRENEDGSGEFTEVRLNPRMTITDPSRIQDAKALHDQAHKLCFVARSVNFAVRHDAVVTCSEPSQ